MSPNHDFMLKAVLVKLVILKDNVRTRLSTSAPV